jgi:hypothetical protein
MLLHRLPHQMSSKERKEHSELSDPNSRGARRGRPCVLANDDPTVNEKATNQPQFPISSMFGRSRRGQGLFVYRKKIKL